MKINVDNYSVQPSHFIVGTRGSRGFETLDIEFAEDWQELSKKIIFRTPSGITVVRRWTGKPLSVPEAVMKESGKTVFAFVGSLGKKRKITVSGELYVLNTLSERDEEDRE